VYSVLWDKSAPEQSQQLFKVINEYLHPVKMVGYANCAVSCTKGTTATTPNDKKSPESFRIQDFPLWYARQESNLRPSESESDTLSS
jgi:hypothetical protein